jgi:uncharacterized membrane protein YcaP (DUF421 family)
MRRVNVTDEKVRASIRKARKGSLAQVQAAVLENDGAWSVIERPPAPELSALVGMSSPEHDA